MPNAGTLDPRAYCRKTLYGKRVTNEKMAREAYRLRQGQPSVGIPPMSLRQIAAKLGYADHKTIRQFLALAGSMAESQPQTPARVDSFAYSADFDAFCQDPLIQKWLEARKHRSRGGVPLKGTRGLVATFKVICDTLQTTPSQWLVGSRDEILENGRQQMESFKELYLAKKACIKYKAKWSAESVNIISAMHGYAAAARNFLYSHGYVYPQGESSAMSQSIVAMHGNYADIAMTNAQYEAAQDYAADHWGVDSDVFRWLTVGLESMSRARALHGMTTEKEIIQVAGLGQVYVMKAFESKTEHYKRGIWTKYIIGKRTQVGIDAVTQKGGTHVIRERDFGKATKDVYPKLKEIYRHLGLPQYFLDHPSHSLRHAGAQFWLRRSNWNVAFVAKMGWRKADELTDSYGAMPADMMLKTLGAIQ